MITNNELVFLVTVCEMGLKYCNKKSIAITNQKTNQTLTANGIAKETERILLKIKEQTE